MTTITIGPIGALNRRDVRDMIFKLGLLYEERKGLLDSLFRVSGPEATLRHLVGHLAEVAKRHAAVDHALFVDDMERVEKRRAAWRRLIGRRVRTETLPRAEAMAMRDLHRQAVRAATWTTEDAQSRMVMAAPRLAALLDPATSDEVASVFASIAMRHLQHDVRTGEVALPRALRRRVLKARPQIDTWGA